MFTGIIEEVGKVVSIKKGQKSSVLGIQGDIVFVGLKIGDSIAVNGVCLTVSAFSNKIFTADVMSETISRSNLGLLNVGAKVNLERAMAANGRFGGHIVSGHIDGTGVITSVKKDDNATWFTVSTAPKVIEYIVEKGSIAIDGISLTVARVNLEEFEVSIIPHTSKATTLLTKKTGDKLNLENDVIGKYVKKFMGLKEECIPEKTEGVTMGFLIENGF